MLFSLFGLVVTVAIIGAAAVMIGRRLAASGPADDCTVCGACGYALRGVSTFECPECGGDLREVGMIPPGRRGRMSIFGVLAIWFVLTGIAGLLTYGVAAGTVIPIETRSTTSETLSRPQSGKFHGVDIDAGSVVSELPLKRNVFQVVQSKVLLSWVGLDEINWQVEIDGATGPWRVMTPTGTSMSGQAFSRSDLDAAFKKSGVPVDDPQVQVELTTIMARVDKARLARLAQTGTAGGFTSTSSGSMPGFSGSSSGGSTMGFQSPAWSGGFFLVWVTLMIGGAVWLWRSRVRRQGRAT